MRRWIEKGKQFASWAGEVVSSLWSGSIETHPIGRLRLAASRFIASQKLVSGVFAVFAGGGVVYAAGGIVMILRLRKAGLPVEGGLSLIPRDELFLIGAEELAFAAVLGLALLLVARTRWLRLAVFLLLLLFVPLTLPGLVWPIGLLVMSWVLRGEPTSHPPPWWSRRSSPLRLAIFTTVVALALTLWSYQDPPIRFAQGQVFATDSALPNRPHACPVTPASFSPSLTCVAGFYLSADNNAVYLGRQANVDGTPKEVIAVPRDTVKEIRLFTRQASSLRTSLVGYMWSRLGHFGFSIPPWAPTCCLREVRASGNSGPLPATFPLVRGARGPGPMAPRLGLGFVYGEQDTGRIWLVDAQNRVFPLAHVGVSVGGDGGLSGLAVDVSDRVFASFVDPAHTMTVAEVSPGPERIVWIGPPVTSATTGARLAFGPDGSLVIGIGATQEPPNNSKQAAVTGKLLALDPDGPPTQTPTLLSSGWHDPRAFVFTESGELWVADGGAGSLPDRLARGDLGGRPARISALRDGTGPVGLAAISDDELVLCGSGTGLPHRYVIGTDGYAVADGPLAGDCRYGVIRLSNGRFAYSAAARIISASIVR